MSACIDIYMSVNVCVCVFICEYMYSHAGPNVSISSSTRSLTLRWRDGPDICLAFLHLAVDGHLCFKHKRTQGSMYAAVYGIGMDL